MAHGRIQKRARPHRREVPVDHDPIGVLLLWRIIFLARTKRRHVIPRRNASSPPGPSEGRWPRPPSPRPARSASPGSGWNRLSSLTHETHLRLRLHPCLPTVIDGDLPATGKPGLGMAIDKSVIAQRLVTEPFPCHSPAACNRSAMCGRTAIKHLQADDPPDTLFYDPPIFWQNI